MKYKHLLFIILGIILFYFNCKMIINWDIIQWRDKPEGPLHIGFIGVQFIAIFWITCEKWDEIIKFLDKKVI